MHRYAQIIIDISTAQLDHPFTYRIPGQMQDSLQLGSFVQVPFGSGNTVRKGYVVGFCDRADYPDEKIKEIQEICSRDAGDAGSRAVELSAWMKERYGSTMITALKTVLPPRRRIRPEQTKEIELLLTREEATKKLIFFTAKHQVARARVLAGLIGTPRQPYNLVAGKLHVSAKTIRDMESAGILKIHVESNLRNPVRIEDNTEDTIQLSAGQQAVVDGVLEDFDALHGGEKAASDAAGGVSGSGAAPADNASCDNGEDIAGARQSVPTLRHIPRCSLLHGITGSGKTEVYIRIIEEIVKRGYQAIMLIPEISLTYQTLLRFYRHFGDRVSVMNSTLSEGEKSDQAERAKRGEIDVIIGPRSALFTPFPKIGVIVIDEEHENSYKNESMPKYHARDVALHIAQMQNAVVLLGSATPSLDSYYHAKEGHFRLYTLTERLTGGRLPSVQIADMRKELREGNRSVMSRQLRDLLEDRLEKGEQSMLFLNRRGYAGFVSCRSCGYVIRCPHCDVALSLHRNGRLVCHYCGYETPNVSKCPECGSPFISGFRAGTEQIEEDLHKMYPKARILRMDADTTARKGGYEKILQAFANEEADILVGTQMIVKGHDFPKVTLVGILLADLSLYAGDYRASERTFQLLTQAAGRAGRGTLPGDVVIQTYDPDNYAIRYAARQDYEGFYNEEIQYRKALMYPPVHHMMAVQITSENDDHAQMEAGLLREQFDKLAAKRWPDGSVLIIGPTQAQIGRLRDEYRYGLYIKSAKYDKLVECKDAAENIISWQQANGMTGIGVQFDFDPVNPY